MAIDFENILDASDELREIVRNWRNNPNVSQYMITNHYISPEEHRRWIENLRTRTTAKAWVIRFDGKPVGVVSLTNINLKERTAEWGFYIADESVRGKGIGSKVLYQLMNYVFDTLHLQTLRTMVLGNNPLALNLYEKFGFRKELAEPRSLQRDTKTIEVLTMAISRDEWVHARTTLQKDIKENSTKLTS
jgi:UDP-4-amino-4,6-dideoxy-N-acetyl-beta-L-altrosamine N-acetyltransferase